MNNFLCPECNQKAWEQWKIDEKDNLDKIDKLVKEGHSKHCACMYVWGIGECICSKGVK